jgi:hypothetical protein
MLRLLFLWGFPWWGLSRRSRCPHSGSRSAGYFKLQHASLRNTRNHSNYKCGRPLWIAAATRPLDLGKGHRGRWEAADRRPLNGTHGAGLRLYYTGHTGSGPAYPLTSRRSWNHQQPMGKGRSSRAVLLWKAGFPTPLPTPLGLHYCKVICPALWFSLWIAALFNNTYRFLLMVRLWEVVSYVLHFKV